MCERVACDKIMCEKLRATMLCMTKLCVCIKMLRVKGMCGGKSCAVKGRWWKMRVKDAVCERDSCVCVRVRVCVYIYRRCILKRCS